MKAYVISAFVILLWVNSVQSQTHRIGKLYGGGIICILSPDSLHGLIIETVDQSKSCNWDDALIAIKDSLNYSVAGKKYSDWRLPTIEELQLIYAHLDIKKLCNLSIPICFESDYYWSGSKYVYTNPDTGDYEYDFANYFKFSDGSIDWTALGNSVSVRAVREF